MTIITSTAESGAGPSLDAFFSYSAREYPARPALFAGGRYWSYSDLDAQCRAIERTLNAAGASGKSHNVGLIYAREAFSYAAIIAIMRSRNVYVPLNPKLPTQKLLRILEDSGIGTVVIDTSEELSDGVVGLLRESRTLRIIVARPGTLPEAGAGRSHSVWCVSDDANFPPLQSEQASLHAAAPASPLAYIIYTSGSTGLPKGVAISHESACRCIAKSHQLFGTHERDRFTEFSALSFDVSILDLFLCWKSGAALYVAAAAEALVPLAFVVRHEITVWSSVPSLANFLLKLRLLKKGALPQVRLFLFCGEALPVELARACRGAAPGSRVINLYGPTECTIFATYHEYDEQLDGERGTVPIGLPLSGLYCRIVDEGRTVETDGACGELWLSGDQLACGYWNNPTATQAAFVSGGPERPEGWYRTGDLVTRQEPVGLLFRGRIDRQVKLRGYRIELQEVESILREVIGCTVVAVVPVRNSGGICEKIIAYCDELTSDEGAIKARCSSRMPHYMVPDRLLRLETFPLNSSGKIDYLALAARTVSTDSPGVTDRRLA